MKMLYIFLAALLLLHQSNADPLDENYGYVDVRDGAHMFWVVYHTELPGDWTTHPLILWLQGGPGSSGVGYGNFWELGPYDINGNLREGRWTKKANLMFVDNPVGTGYSYVDSPGLYCRNNTQIAKDLVTMLTSVFTDYPDMQIMPFFIYAESYGGKMTADFAIALDEAISNGDINCNFQGIAMGDSWISPMDSVNTWGSYLYWMGMVNSDGQAQIDAAAAQTQSAVDEGDWGRATTEWSITEGVVETVTYGVDFYNVLVEDSNAYFLSESDNKKYSYLQPELRKSYFRHVRPYSRKVGDDLDDFMNGPQKEHWNIPDNVTWGGQSGQVFEFLRGDFMKPVVDSVAYLLNNSHIHVAVYSGDLDLICDTPGTYLWIDNMNYDQKSGYQSTKRDPLYVTSFPNVAAYNQRFERFSVFTILRSGHMVPLDAPEVCLEMIDIITGYGNETVNAAKEKVEVAKDKLKHELAKKLQHGLKEKQEKPVLHELEKHHEEAKKTLHEKVESVHEDEEQKNEKVNLEEAKKKIEQAHKIHQLREAAKKMSQKHEQEIKETKEKAEATQNKKKILKEKLEVLHSKAKQEKPKPKEEILKEKLEEVLHNKDKQEKPKLEVAKKSEPEHKEKQIKELVKEIKEKQENREESNKIIEALKEKKEKHEENEKMNKVNKVNKALQKENEERENALRKLRLKKKILAHKAAEKQKEKSDHPNHINADSKRDLEHEKEVKEKLKAIFQKEFDITSDKKEEKKQ